MARYIDSTYEKQMISVDDDSIRNEKRVIVEQANKNWRGFVDDHSGLFVSASSEFDFVFEDGNNLSSTIGDALMEMLTENMKDLIINSGWEWNPVHERQSINSPSAHYVLIVEKNTENVVGYLDSRFGLEEFDDKMVLFLLLLITFIIY